MTFQDPRPYCTGKRAYPSPQAAWRFALSLRVKPSRKLRAVYVKAEPQQPYRCPCCGMFHCRRPS